jgi:hypothetical protein
MHAAPMQRRQGALQDAMIRLMRRCRSWRRAISAVRKQHRRAVGRPLRLFPPRGLGDKLQWRKLFDLDPDLSIFCDKLATRDYVAERLGPGVLVPLIWSGDNPAELPLETLEPPFVVKCTHGSGFNLFVRDGRTDFANLRAQLSEWLAIDYGLRENEPGYRTVPRRIMVEPYLAEESGFAPEYKFFVFDGAARLVLARRKFGEAESERTNDFYTLPWRHAPTRKAGVTALGPQPPPPELDLMRTMAETLAGRRDQLRVDFLIAQGRVYVGELTPYHWSGHTDFEPAHFDRAFGEFWRVRRPILRALWTMASNDCPLDPPR